MYTQILTQDPFSAVVTLEEAKKQCRVTHTFDDDYITALVPVACELAQSYTRRLIVPSTVALVIESYASSLQLPFGEATVVTEVLIDDVETTDFTFEPVTQKVIFGETVTFSKCKITYDCGYTVVPSSVKHAILMLISTMYNSREDAVSGVTVQNIPMTSQHLLNSVRYYGI